MKSWFGGMPVGWPGLVVMTVGLLAFFGALARLNSPRAERNNQTAVRARASVFGIALQMFGFASAGFGSIRVALPAFGFASIGEAIMVAAFTASAVALFSGAARELGKNWSLVARIRKDHELVTTGVFAYIRHPIYTTMSLLLLAMAVSFGHERNLVWAIPLFVAGTWLRVRQEEKLLRATFGSAADRYAERVKRFVPGLI